MPIREITREEYEELVYLAGQQTDGFKQRLERLGIAVQVPKPTKPRRFLVQMDDIGMRQFDVMRQKTLAGIIINTHVTDIREVNPITRRDIQRACMGQSEESCDIAWYFSDQSLFAVLKKLGVEVEE